MNNDELTELELAILGLLRTGPLEMDAIAKAAGLNQSQVIAAAGEMQRRGLMNLSESEREEMIPEPGAANLIPPPILPSTHWTGPTTFASWPLPVMSRT